MKNSGMDTLLTFHEIADIFPLLEGEKFEGMVQDIRERGLQHAIMLFDGQILDGRNRYRACMAANVNPRFETFSGDYHEAFHFVWGENIHRRDLDSGQRAAAWIKREQMENEYAAKLKAGIEADAKERHKDGVKRGGSIAGRSRPKANSSTQTFEYTYPESKRVPEVSSANRNENLSTETRAKAAGTNRQYIADVEAIQAKKPELVDAIIAGTISVPKAKIEIKREEHIARLQDIKTQEAKAVSGLFDVIVIDPPWDMQKIERDVRPNQSEFDYPTMSESELSELSIPAADDCHIWVWTTHKFLPMAFRLLDVWKLKYVCTFVWHKPGGFQPIGLPQYNCEFALYARKGIPIFLDTKAFNTCLNAERGKHSEKPEVFYEMVRRVTTGRRLDMFNRRVIDGFHSWGNEGA